MISRAQDVGNVMINRLESGIRYLPFFNVFGLRNVSHMYRHDYIQLLLSLLDPFGLRKETGTLITNAWPMLLRLFVPYIGVTLSVRQTIRVKEAASPTDSLFNGVPGFFSSSA